MKKYVIQLFDRSLFLVSFASLTLSGCSSNYSNKFDCPYGEGLGCASVSKVNKMLDAQMVDTQDYLPSTVKGNPQQQIPIYFGPNRPSQNMIFNGIPVL